MNEWFGIKKKKLLHRRVVITVLGRNQSGMHCRSFHRPEGESLAGSGQRMQWFVNKSLCSLLMRVVVMVDPLRRFQAQRRSLWLMKHRTNDDSRRYPNGTVCYAMRGSIADSVISGGTWERSDFATYVLEESEELSSQVFIYLLRDSHQVFNWDRQQ